jgi:hypothetical protein
MTCLIDLSDPITDSDPASVGWPVSRMVHWTDQGWWTDQIDSAIADPEPAAVNSRITLLHRELALALRRVTGADAGPTYHAWAVWASVKAGRVIRGEEGSSIVAGAPLAGFATGCLTASASLGGHGIAGAVGVGVLAAVATQAGARRARSRASSAILAGNVAVIDDVGRHSARFACMFARPEDRTEDTLEDFLAPLSSVPSAEGGQSLLRDAYQLYFRAAGEGDPLLRDQAVLLGNLSILLHEHWRLQRFFDTAIPPGARRIVTAHLLHYEVAGERLSVGRDVPPLSALDDYPPTLTDVVLPELQTFLDQWDRTPNTPKGSAARDWTHIGDRMNYIVELLRTRHHNPELFRAPFDQTTQALILARGDCLHAAMAESIRATSCSPL